MGNMILNILVLTSIVITGISGHCDDSLVEIDNFYHTHIDKRILASEKCPYKEEAPYWAVQDLEVLVEKNDYEYVRANLDEADGHYRISEKSKFFGDVAYAPANITVSGSGDCLGYHAKLGMAIFDRCDNLTKICFYRKDESYNFCMAYEKICRKDLTSDNPCYCHTTLTDEFYCKRKCFPQDKPNYCNCDEKFQQYGEPKLHLSLDGENLVLEIQNILKLKHHLNESLEDSEPVVCYQNTQINSFNIAFNSQSDLFRLINIAEEDTHTYRVEPIAGRLKTGVYFCRGFSYPNFTEITSNAVYFRDRASDYNVMVNITNTFPVLYDTDLLMMNLSSLLVTTSATASIAGFSEKEQATAYITGTFDNGNNLVSTVEDIKERLGPILRSEISTLDVCLEMVEYISDLKLNLTWPTTEIGQKINSTPKCTDVNGKTVERECLKDSNYGVCGVWGPPSGQCYTPSVQQVSEELNDLLQKNNYTSEEINQHLNEIIKSKGGAFDKSDIVLVAKVIEKISAKNKNYTLGVLIDSVNLVMDFEKQILIESQTALNGTDSILGAFDGALKKYLESFVESDFLHFSENIDVLLAKIPNINHGYGVAFHSNNRITNFHDVDLDIMDTDDIEVIIYFPASLIKDTDNTVMSIFKKDSFFNADELENSKLTGFVPSVTLDSNTLNNQYLEIYVKPSKSTRRDSYCNFWKYGAKNMESNRGFWSNDHKATRVQDFHLCRYNHTTHFAVLLDLPGDETLKIVSGIGSAISLVTIGVIYVTAVFSRKWREADGAKILLNFCTTIVIQISFLYAANCIDSYDNEALCVIVGVFLHYGVISQFFWMIIMGILQYRKFIVIFTASYKHLLLIVSVIGWICPVLPVLLTLLLEYESYIQDEYCYLSGSGLYWGVFLPLSLTLIVNITIFVRIFYEFKFARRVVAYGPETNQTFLYVKLGIFLFFILGFSWIFGILNGFFRNIVFSYIFCVFASIQGLVLFWFYVVKNKDAARVWRKLFGKIVTLPNSDSQATNSLSKRSNSLKFIREKIGEGNM